MLEHMMVLSVDLIVQDPPVLLAGGLALFFVFSVPLGDSAPFSEYPQMMTRVNVRTIGHSKTIKPFTGNES
jgi:hypothetical protein